MSAGRKTTTATPQFTSGTADNGDTERYYAGNPRQLAPWYKRLTRRRYPLRNFALYALVAIIIALSSPALPTFVAGAILVIAGLALRIWTFGHLEKNLSMVTTGPYAHTRNPAYLGSFVIACGLVLAAGNPDTVVGLAVWGLGIVMLVLFFRYYLPRKYAREYPGLARRFPDSYRRHAANVPDFAPRLTPWRSGDNRRFAWAGVMANHELCWPAALTVALAVIWLF